MIFDMKKKKLYRDLEDWVECNCPVEDCNDCPIGFNNNGKKCRCSQFVKLYPDSALRLLWDSVKEVQSEAEIKKELEGVEMENMENMVNVKENQEEKKMSLKIFDENATLKEVQELCKSREECQGCPVRGTSFCRVDGRLDKWDLTFLPPFTDDELAWMRVMSSDLGENEVMWLGRDVLTTLYWKIENEDTGESRKGYLPRELFPQIQPGQRYELREVLR